jgi:hypothetical protein
LEKQSITADKLVQTNRIKTNKLIRDLYLLACRASFSSSEIENKKAVILSNYARAIKQISNDYDNLFGRRRSMTEAVTLSESNSEVAEDSAINTIDRLQARLFYLMTQYTVNPCIHLAGHIVELLTNLCQHPHIELLPAQHYIYSQSLNYWRSQLISNSKVKDIKNLH